MKRLFLLACIVAILAVRGYSQSASGGQTGAPNTSASVTIPAGTRILMTLTSPLHTTSAQPGSGVYLEITEPVVYEDRVVIPPHSRVLGVVQQERRPGRIKGRAQLRLQFNTLILPDNHTLAIMGALQSLPGSSRDRTKDAEGTIEPVDQIDRDVYMVARGALSGGAVGALVGRGAGAARGGAIGGGIGLAKALFTRGDEIHLPAGTQVEMVLQRPLTFGPKQVR